MRSIHGVGELMSQVVLRGGGFLPTTSNNSPNGSPVKTQTEPEKQDILVMDTKLKIIEILQVKHKKESVCVHVKAFPDPPCFCILQIILFFFLLPCCAVHPERPPGLQDLLPAVDI